MSRYRNIYVRHDCICSKNGLFFVNAHFLVGYNQARIQDYLEMASEIRKVFSKAKIGEMICSMVTQSTYCKGFTLLHYSCTVTKEELSAIRRKHRNWRIIDVKVVDEGKPTQRTEGCADYYFT